MEPSMDEVQQEMQNVVLAGPVKERADRTMRAIREKNPTILASPENVKLTAALQSLGVQRINGAVFGAWSEKLKHEESVEHPIYIQLKDNQPDLDKNPVVRKWMYEPSQIDGRIDKDKYWFVDMGVGDQGLLGFGAMIWRSKVSVTSKPTGPLPVDPVVPEAEKRPAAQDHEGAEPLKKARVLTSEPSLSDTPEEVVTENRIASTKEAFQKKLFVLPDKLLPYSAEFQLREHKVFLLKKATEAKAKGVPLLDLLQPHVHAFLKFFVKWQLEADTFAVGAAFSDHYQELRAAVPEVMPVLTHAVEIVFAFPLDSPLDACLELEELGLNCAQRDFLFASEFFKGFMRARFQAQEGAEGL